MFSQINAWEISDLLTQSNGLPNPKDLWNILHGGEAPANITLENFTQKLMNQLAREFNVYKTIMDQKYVDFSTFISSAKLSYGISPILLLQKMSRSLDEDFTIDFTEQKLKAGMFTIGNGSQYKNGSEAFGFALDFYRAGMPSGAEGAEGNKITVVAQGKSTDFTLQEYERIRQEGANQGINYNPQNHPLIQNLVDTVRPLCATTEQLASVGLCTSQAVQGSLGALKTAIYKDVTAGGTFEHTALDFEIQALENGHIQVTVKEKPGSLFNLRLKLDVDQAGNVNIEEGKVSYVSLNKYHDFVEQSLANQA